MAKRRHRDAVDREEIERQVDVARYFLRIALDPPLMPGLARDEACTAIVRRLAAADAETLRRLAHEHRDHPAVQHALMALDRAQQ